MTILGACGPSTDNKKTFSEVTPANSGVHFANRIAENDTFNILDLEYVYNGGGVGIGDFNNDGLQDIYLSGNTADNALYLNKGNFNFEDVTEKAEVAAQKRWCSGVTVVDINADGLDDIYVSATVLEPAHRRTNLLYINDGPDQNGIPRFSESSKAYGLADSTHSTNAVFLDYDLDGDLDCYVLVNHMDDKRVPNLYRPKVTDGTSVRNDKLYRNEGIGKVGHPVFTEVTKEAGILKDGYGLGVAVCDLNEDGWPDIYIANDYLSNDLAWINQQNGTFKDEADQLTKHTSYSAMGVDVADINGDTRSDILTLDMLPGSNFRRKTMVASANFNNERNNRRFKYQPQYMRNVLQLNRGKLSTQDSLPIFSEIGFFSGISATDWSWSVLSTDVDLDSDLDLLITNGFPRDITDLDFMDYSSSLSSYSSPALLMEKIPSVLISNYGYENDGNLVPQFENSTEKWGLKRPSFSSGAATVDLDNDGDLDYVVNCINDSILLYRNDTRTASQIDKHYLQVVLNGNTANKSAFGAEVTITIGDRSLRRYQSPYRGYLSTVSKILNFGLDTFSTADVSVRWPDGKVSYRRNVRTDQRITFDQKEGKVPASAKTVNIKPYLREVAAQKGIDFQFEETLFVDFDIQRLLPRQLSQFGPVLCVGDANSDGLDDLLIGGPLDATDLLWLQNQDGTFALDDSFIPIDTLGETTSALFFDADGDGDEDLYIAHGSVELRPGHEGYQDVFYRNVNGKLSRDKEAIPAFTESSSCVRAGDFDRDGDLDLFVGARTVAGQFPRPAKSVILLNDGGNFSFKQEWQLSSLGMVTDAVVIDIDQDGWQDLFITEDWGKIRHFESGKAGFSESEIDALKGKTGCWNSLLFFDGDNDGDLDIVAGNLGRNNIYHRDGRDFARIYAGDFDNNGTLDAIPATRFDDENGEAQLYTLFQRQENQMQVIKIKDVYPFHKDFAEAKADEIIIALGGNDSLTVEVNYLASIYLEHEEDGSFTLQELPREAQLAPIYGMSAEDINNDGTPELLLTGNDYGIEVRSGQMDALHGLVLSKDKNGSWLALPNIQTGLNIIGDGTGMVKVLTADGQLLNVVGQNRGKLLAFAKTEAKGTYKRVNDSKTQVDGQATPFGMGNASSGGRYIRME